MKQWLLAFLTSDTHGGSFMLWYIAHSSYSGEAAWIKGLVCKLWRREKSFARVRGGLQIRSARFGEEENVLPLN
jgi:hypothetical protein